MGVIKQGLIKRVREEALVPFLGVRCLKPWFAVKASTGGAG